MSSSIYRSAAVSVVLFFLLVNAPTMLAAPPTTYQISRLTSSGVQENAALIHGNLVVFRRHHTPDVDIFGYNLDTGKEFPLVQRYGNQTPNGLFGNLLLYTEYSFDPIEQHDVRLLNIETGEDTLIAGGPGSQHAGAVWGNHTVYTDGGVCGPLILYHNATKKHEQITDTACQPIRIWRNQIVWRHPFPGGGGDIYGYASSFA